MPLINLNKNNNQQRDSGQIQKKQEAEQTPSDVSKLQPISDTQITQQNNVNNSDKNVVSESPNHVRNTIQQGNSSQSPSGIEVVGDLNLNNSTPAQGELKNTNQNLIEQDSLEGSQEDIGKRVNEISEKLNEVDIQNTTAPNMDVVQNQSQEQLVDASKLSQKTYSLNELLGQAAKMNASDLHLAVGYRAIVRIDGKLQRINSQLMTVEMLNQFSKELLASRQHKPKQNEKEVDMSYSIGETRFRINIFKQLRGFTIVARIIPNKILRVEELKLPPIVSEFSNIQNGLVLVTGPTGSGKSTTIAAILNEINMRQSRHLVTLEDPVEFVFPKGTGLVDQREFGADFNSWKGALRSVLRQDPDVVLVGEMRDYETIASTITVSETGHLVFATLHTNSASQTVDRIIDVFPESQQTQVRAQLANVLTAVISQKLIPVQGGGRRAAVEIMIATPAIRSNIREGKTYQIDNLIQTGQDVSMITMEKSLANLVRQGMISVDTAKAHSIRPDEIDLLLNGVA